MADTHWIVDDFAAALAQLESALAEPADRDLIKAGSIQYFELGRHKVQGARFKVEAPCKAPHSNAPHASIRPAP